MCNENEAIEMGPCHVHQPIHISLNLMQPNPDPKIDARTIGQLILRSRGFFKDNYVFWICIGALFGFSLLFNILFIGALTYLSRKCYYLF